VNTVPHAINNRTQIVGRSDTTPGSNHAFLWEDGIMKDLGTLSSIPFSGSGATCINDSGQVVGLSDGKVFLWERGTMRDLGLPRFTLPQALNNRGDIVGWTSTSGGLHAFIWRDGVLTDLGTLGGCCSTAYAVNNQGEVVGWASRSDGTAPAAVWRPSK
jgi:probable HAF family extracellular repeat protein